MATWRFERRAMGSPLRLTIVSPPDTDTRQAEADWQAASDDIERSEAALSRFRDDAEITVLNRRGDAPDGAGVAVSARLYAALAAAEKAWRRTGGRFDPRVLVDLERLGYNGAPSLPAAGTTISREGPWLDRDPRRRVVRLAAPVDLGGIGKGLALRWAVAALVRRSASRPLGVLLEAGGDVVALGRAPQGGPWRIGIEDPMGGSEPIAVVELADAAMCTSSTSINRWPDESGRLVHHLIDPATGEPGGAGLRAVTVSSLDPAWAEVWSKTAFLDGPSAVADRLRGRGLAGWWVEADGTARMTPGARLMTIWDRDRAGPEPSGPEAAPVSGRT